MSQPRDDRESAGVARKAKGVLLADHVRMIRRAKNPRLLETLSPEDRVIVASRVMSSTWYPYGTYARTLDVIFREFAGSDPEVARDMGRFMASHLLAGPYAMYVKAGDPESTLRGFQLIWKNFFDFGAVRLSLDDSTPPSSGRRVFFGVIEDFPDLPKALCYIVQGFIDKTIEMCGASERSIAEVTCVATGHPLCSYRVGWKAPAA